MPNIFRFQLHQRIHQDLFFPPQKICNTVHGWTGHPISTLDSQIQCLILTGCLNRFLPPVSTAFSFFSHSIHLSFLSSVTFHHHMSPLSLTYLSLLTNAKPVVTDKASLTNCNTMEECVWARPSSGFGCTYTWLVGVNWSGLGLGYMINNFL